MSTSFHDQQATTTPAEHVRRFFTGIFASGIENARMAAGRSINEAARLAGMELSEWMALEAGGLLPQTPEQLRAIAGALAVDFDWMASWVLLCWSAWEG
jgi:transcriptional regulator with XRE-family HTH domain